MDPVADERVAGQPGYEWAAARIASHIATGGLHPGDRLPTERSLGEQLGVSRTVVREAIRVLAARGLVRARQGSGLYVADDPQPFATAALDLSMPVDPEHMLNLFEFRRTLEMQSARLAAERITPRELRRLEEALTQHGQMALEGAFERLDGHYDYADLPNPDRTFHQIIAEGTHNNFFATTVTTVHRLQSRAIALVLNGAPGSYLIAADQHRAIFESIRQGQPEAAALAMETHIQTVRTGYQQEVRRLLGGEPAALPDLQ